MADQPNKQNGQTTESKQVNNRWNDLSDDDEESSSSSASQQDNQEIQDAPVQETKVPEGEPVAAKKQSKQAKQPHIKSFDPRFLKGAHKNMKKIKGGFKSQKLEKKKFELNAINNPFAAAESSSDEDEEQNNQNTPKEVDTAQVEQPKQQPKEQAKKQKPKKNKKKQEQDIDALLKQMGVSSEKGNQAAQEQKKKKKKNKNKNKEKNAEQATQEQPKAPENESQKVEEFTVDKQKLEEVLKKKAENKNANKKKPKVTGVEAAKKAIEQREAKNKGKKQFLDL